MVGVYILSSGISCVVNAPERVLKNSSVEQILLNRRVMSKGMDCLVWDGWQDDLPSKVVLMFGFDINISFQSTVKEHYRSGDNEQRDFVVGKGAGKFDCRITIGCRLLRYVIINH